MKFWDQAKAAGRYVAQRFNKKEASTWVGLALVLASAGGYLTLEQVALVKAIAAAFGVEVDIAASLLAQISTAAGLTGAGAIVYKPGKVNAWALTAIGASVFALVAPAPADAAPVVVSYAWSKPTTRADGTALSAAEIKGYKIECKVPGADWVSVDVAGGGTEEHRVEANIPNMTGAPIASSITARTYTVDTGGLVSVPSKEIATPVEVAPDVYPPSAPGEIRATVSVSVTVTPGVRTVSAAGAQ